MRSPILSILILALVPVAALAWGPQWGEEGFEIAFAPEAEHNALLAFAVQDCLAEEGQQAPCHQLVCGGYFDGLDARFGGSWDLEPVNVCAD
jgi:hypothetical protein